MVLLYVTGLILSVVLEMSEVIADCPGIPLVHMCLIYINDTTIQEEVQRVDIVVLLLTLQLLFVLLHQLTIEQYLFQIINMIW